MTSALRTILRRRLGGLALTGWFVLMSSLAAGLLAKHTLALPLPAASARLATSTASLRRPEDRGRWLAVHVLSSECRCSLRVARHLAGAARPADWAEIVLWVGAEPPPAALAERGLFVLHETAREVAALGFEGAPILVILDPDDHVRYAGGYTDRKQGPVIEDMRLMSETRAGRAVSPLPLFGCAVSDRLQRELSKLPTP